MEKLFAQIPAHTTIIRVGGADYAVPAYLWQSLEGPRPRPAFFLESDGCSCSPDVMRFLVRLFKRKRPVLLFPACWIHDAHYRRVEGADLGGTWGARRQADWLLARNLHRLCRLQKVNRTGAITIATAYWIGVRMYGAPSYAFDPGQHPLGRLQRWREIALLFLEGPDYD